MTKPMTYADAGVDVEKANDFIDTIKEIAGKTRRSGVIGEIGGFGGLFSLNLANLDHPVLVSSTDGVGTKLKIAFIMNKHDTIGIDLVAMCVNDIAVQGAKPLFFLDYLSMGKLDTNVAGDIVKGIGEGCNQAKAALIGGETAEMPGLYKPNEYDLAGFAVGIVDNDKILESSEIRVGHKLVGIASNGLHSNGYSLVRKICFDVLKLNCDDHIDEFDRSLGEELLTPTRIYSSTIQNILRELPVHGLAHITGGGIEDNILRIVPEACQVIIEKGSWNVPPVFHFLQKAGHITDNEMMRTFNNGIGLIAVIAEDIADELLERLSALDEKAYIIGEVANSKKSGDRIKWV